MHSIARFPTACLATTLLPGLIAGALAACTGSPTTATEGDPDAPRAAATWSKSLGGPGNDWANAVIATRDGGYVAVGVMDHQALASEPNATARDGDVWAVKLDSLGDRVWQQRLGERATAAAAATSTIQRVRAAADGYWMVGTQTAAGPSGSLTAEDAISDLVVSRLEADGTVRWSRAYDSGPFTNYSFFFNGATSTDTGWDIAALSDGGALIAGWSKAELRTSPTSSNVGGAAWVARLSPDGAVIWSRRLADAPFEHLDFDPTDLRVIATAQGGALVAASIRLRGTEADPATLVTLLDSGGASRWSRRYSRFVTRDMIQIEANYDRLADDDFLLVGEDLGTGYSLDDDDGMLLRLALDDGSEVWRAVIEEATQLNAVAQVCRPSPAPEGKFCHFNAVGIGAQDDSGTRVAMAAYVSLTGGYTESAYYSEMRSAEGIRLVEIGAFPVDTPFEIIGWGSDGRPKRLRVSATLNRLEPSIRDAAVDLNDSSTTNGPRRLTLEKSGTVVALRSSQASRIAVADQFNTQQFERTFGADTERASEQGADVVEVSDGYVVAASTGGAISEDSATVLAKLTPDGAVRWQARLDDFSIADPGLPGNEALADAGNGNVLVVGMTRGTSSAARAALIDASGSVLWTSEGLNVLADYAPNWRAFVASVQRLSGGDFLVTGGTHVFETPESPAKDGVPWLARINGDGAVVWARLVTPSVYSVSVTSMRALPGDGAIIAGLIETPAGGRAPWAGRMGADGAFEWTRVYEPPNADSVATARIAVAATGGYLLVAPTRDTSTVAGIEQFAARGRYNLLALRLDANGDVRWNKVFGALMDEFPYAIDSTSDGGFIIAGRSDSLGERAEAWFLRIGADGQVAAGCNAQLPNFTYVNASATNLSAVRFEETRARRDTVRSPLAGRAAPLPAQSVGDTALARQCSGVASAEGAVSSTPRFRLRLEQGSTITPGVVTSAPSGISCGTGAAACSANYFANTTVTLRIDPGAGAYFLGWQGCDQTDGGICIATMTADRTVTANFRAPDAPSLRMTVIGNGTVTGNGLDCRAGSGSCSATLPAGTTMSLFARPDATEQLLRWDGDCAAFGTASPIGFALTSSRDCSAFFTGAPPGSPRVSVTIEPSTLALVLGNVISSPPGILCGRDAQDCSQTFAFDSEVRIEARATSPGWDIETIDCQGIAAPRGTRSVHFTAVSDVPCTARFADNIERLSVQIARDDVITVGRVYTAGAAAPRSLDCTSSCDRPFTRNTIVELRPDTTSSESASWIGCDSTYIDTNAFRNPVVCRVLMDRPRHVAAFFVRPNLAGNSINHVAASFLPDSNGGEVRIRPRLPDRTAQSCTPAGGACEVVFFPTDIAIIDIIQSPGRPLTYHEGCDTLTLPTTTDYAQCRVSMARNRVVRFSFGGANVAPTARITRAPPGDVAVNEVVSFSGAGSTDDQDVAQLSYGWDFDADGVIDATGVNASYAFTSAGVYDVALRVTDAARASGTAIATVTVNAGINRPPVASFVFAPTSPQVGTTVSFDASASSDDGRVVRYEWDFNGDGTFDVTGTPNDARMVSFNYSAAGTYTVRLRVTDDLNASAETTRTVTVSSAANNSDLTLTISGGGAGVVTYTPGATACSNETGASQIVCVRQFPKGTQVVLRGFAYTGSRLGEWNGCDSVNAAGNECTLNLTGNRNVTLFLVR